MRWRSATSERRDVDGVDRALGRSDDAAEALGEVLPLVYGELREIALRTLGAGGPPSVQPTDLVHEAYLRLSSQRNGWPDRSNLMVAAAVAMRRVLVDHLRRKRAAKRGGGASPRGDLERIAIHDRVFDTLALEDALGRLAEEEPAAAQVAELRLFGELDGETAARALGVSKRTVERRWRFARAWLITELGGGERGD